MLETGAGVGGHGCAGGDATRDSGAANGGTRCGGTGGDEGDGNCRAQRPRRGERDGTGSTGGDERGVGQRAFRVRPGMQCLLEILRGQIGDRAIDEVEWDDALALAEEEHVVAWAVAGARARNVALTPAIANRLVQIERDAAIAAFYWTSELK